MKNLSAIILAAGYGTRMKSKKPKIFHEVAGKPMLFCIIDQLKLLKPEKIVIVVGSRAIIKDYENIFKNSNIKYVVQKEKLGTAHAVRQAEKELKNYKGDLLILNGDVPLITAETLKRLVIEHRSSFAVLSLLTAEVPDPTGYGRIVRKNNELYKIVEETDADDFTRLIKEINAGTYCFKAKHLFEVLKKIKKNPIKGEYYITDAVEILSKEGAKIHTVKVYDYQEVMGVNRRYELEKANKIMQRRIQRKLMEQGITIIDVENTYIEYDVQIGQDTVIYPFTLLYGNTVIGENCQIGPFVQIINSKIGNNSSIFQSRITDSKLEEGITVGPYAHIRNNSVLYPNVHIGNFVEITRSKIGEKTRAYHLSYLGDAEIGKNVNFGAGIITANYDGKKKNKTIIGDNSFIGSGTTIIAPAKIKNGEIVRSGSLVKTSRKRERGDA